MLMPSGSVTVIKAISCAEPPLLISTSTGSTTPVLPITPWPGRTSRGRALSPKCSQRRLRPERVASAGTVKRSSCQPAAKDCLPRSRPLNSADRVCSGALGRQKAELATPTAAAADHRSATADRSRRFLRPPKCHWRRRYRPRRRSNRGRDRRWYHARPGPVRRGRAQGLSNCINLHAILIPCRLRIDRHHVQDVL